MTPTSFQAHQALQVANRIRRDRYAFRVELRRVAVDDGDAAARAQLADAIVTVPDYLAGMMLLDVLQWAPRVGERDADRLCAWVEVWPGRRLGSRELTLRRRRLLAEALRCWPARPEPEVESKPEVEAA